MRWSLSLSLATSLVIASLGQPRLHAQDEGSNPRAFVSDTASETQPLPSGDQPPVFVIQDGPIDLESLRQRLSSPDLVILNGGQYDALKSAAKPTGAAVPAHDPTAATIESVLVRGQAGTLQSSARIQYTFTVPAGSQLSADLGLRGQAISSAQSEGREVPLRLTADGSWQARIDGPGQRLVDVQLPLAVRNESDSQRLELAIPPAASTRLELEIEGRVSEAWLEDGVPLEVLPVTEGGQRSLIRASLSPRSRLAVSWRLEADPGTTTPPVLAVQGEIAIEIDRGTVLSRSTWAIRCDRGTTRQIQLQLAGGGERVESVELDDQPLATSAVIEPDGTLLSVTLDEPLRAGAARPRKLTLTTRRDISAGVTTRLSLNGYPVVHALGQSGVLAISQGEDLWVSASMGRGLRQIKPGVELPESLRNRPRTVLAYQFNEQPFDLVVRVDPSPPAILVDRRATVMVGSEQVEIQTDLAYQVIRGRVQELRLAVPERLEVLTVGPESVVSSFQVLEGGEGGEGGRVLIVRLAARPNGEGPFPIQLTTRQPTIGQQQVDVAFCQPMGVQAGNTIAAVVSERDILVELGAAMSGTSRLEFELLGTPPPLEWLWPASKQAAAAALWLRSDGLPRSLPLRIEPQPLELHHQTTVTAQLDLRRVDVSQTTVCHVRNGGITRLEVLVPAVFEAPNGLWGTEGALIVDRQRLGIEPDGSVRYALSLAREVIDTVELVFWGRVPLAAPLNPTEPTRVSIAWLRLRDDSSSPLEVQLQADAGIRLEPEGAGWTVISGGVAPAARTSTSLPRLRWLGPEEGSGPPAVLATAPAPARMPELVISRLWMRVVHAPSGDVQNEVWMRVESHQGSLELALPAGATPVQARVGNDPTSLESGSAENTLRIKLPLDSSGPLLVGLTYIQPATERSAGVALPPRLQQEAVVLDSLLEVRLPWSEALLGTPAGWTDENHWYWAGYVWKRRPNLSIEELTRWISGPAVRGRVVLTLEGEQRLGDHAYLFGRPGTPHGLEMPRFSRAALVALCSGSALGVGILLLLLRATPRLIGLSLAGAGVAAGLAITPAVMLVAVQAAMPGILLALLAGLTQWALDRRRPPPVARETTSAGSRTSSLKSPLAPEAPASLAPVNPDASTVIRQRVAATSTVSHPAARSDSAVSGEPDHV